MTQWINKVIGYDRWEFIKKSLSSYLLKGHCDVFRKLWKLLTYLLGQVEWLLLNERNNCYYRNKKTLNVVFLQRNVMNYPWQLRVHTNTYLYFHYLTKFSVLFVVWFIDTGVLEYTIALSFFQYNAIVILKRIAISHVWDTNVRNVRFSGHLLCATFLYQSFILSNIKHSST